MKHPISSQEKHEFKKSKDFPQACLICEYTRANPIHWTTKNVAEQYARSNPPVSEQKECRMPDCQLVLVKHDHDHPNCCYSNVLKEKLWKCEDCKQWVKAKGGQFIKGEFKIDGHDCSLSVKEGWEKEWDDLYAKTALSSRNLPASKIAKDFIRKTIALSLQEEREKVAYEKISELYEEITMLPVPEESRETWIKIREIIADKLNILLKK